MSEIKIRTQLSSSSIRAAKHIYIYNETCVSFAQYFWAWILDHIVIASIEIYMIHSYLQTLKQKSKYPMYSVAQCYLIIDRPDSLRNHSDIFTGKFNCFEYVKGASQ